MGSSASRHEQRRERRQHGAGGGAGQAQGQGQQAQTQQRQRPPQQQQYPRQIPQTMFLQQGAWLQEVDPRRVQQLLGMQYAQQQQRLAPVPQIRQQTTTVKSLANLKKPTLKFVRNAMNPNLYSVEFTFDCLADIAVTVFFLAKEVDGIVTSELPGAAPQAHRYATGLNQTFSLPVEESLDLSRVRVADMVRTPNEQQPFPLIIDLRVVDADLEAANNVSLQMSFAVLVPDGPNFNIKILKQKVKSGATFYELQAIYGIGQAADPASGESSKECVICLSAPCDTTVIPCRHMCMCIDCAKVLRLQTNKCPVCRAPVESILQIHSAASQEATPTPPPPQQAPPQYQTQPAPQPTGAAGGYNMYATTGGMMQQH